MGRKSAAGFTLIELMIVVVVVAILAAVAYPSYQDHVRKAKRAEGKAALLKAAQVLERYYSDRAIYVTDLGPLFGQAANAPVYSAEDPKDTRGAYQVRVSAATGGCPLAACFLVTATPRAPHTDAQCGILTITSTGVRCWSTTDPPDAAVVMTCQPAPANAAICKW